MVLVIRYSFNKMYISLQVEHFFMITRNRRSQPECKIGARGSARHGGNRGDWGTQVSHCGSLWGPRTPPAPPGHKGVFPKPDSAFGMLHQLHPTPQQAPCPPSPSLWRRGIRNADQPHPSDCTGGFLGVCEGIHPPTAETAGWGYF